MLEIYKKIDLFYGFVLCKEDRTKGKKKKQYKRERLLNVMMERRINYFKSVHGGGTRYRHKSILSKSFVAQIWSLEQ